MKTATALTARKPIRRIPRAMTKTQARALTAVLTEPQRRRAVRIVSPPAQPAASIDLSSVLKILIPLLPLLKPIVKQLILDNLDPALDALFKAITDAAAKT